MVCAARSTWAAQPTPPVQVAQDDDNKSESSEVEVLPQPPIIAGEWCVLAQAGKHMTVR
jgi:hypothetical protein